MFPFTSKPVRPFVGGVRRRTGVFTFTQMTSPKLRISTRSPSLVCGLSTRSSALGTSGTNLEFLPFLAGRPLAMVSSKTVPGAAFLAAFSIASIFLVLTPRTTLFLTANDFTVAREGSLPPYGVVSTKFATMPFSGKRNSTSAFFRSPIRS